LNQEKRGGALGGSSPSTATFFHRAQNIPGVIVSIRCTGFLCALSHLETLGSLVPPFMCDLCRWAERCLVRILVSLFFSAAVAQPIFFLLYCNKEFLECWSYWMLFYSIYDYNHIDYRKNWLFVGPRTKQSRPLVTGPPIG